MEGRAPTFRDIRVTLYDVFGFLLPGCLFLLAGGVLGWALVAPDEPLAFPDLSTPAWFLVLLLAYVAGHLAHAIGNALFDRRVDSEGRALAEDGARPIPTAVVGAAARNIRRLTGINAAALDPLDFYMACDELVAWRGDPGDRDVYIYRQGFYRGASVALMGLAVAVFVRALVAAAGTPVRLEGVGDTPAWPLLVVLAAGLAYEAYLCFGRFRRFGDYRVRHAVFSVAVMRAADGQEERGATDA